RPRRPRFPRLRDALQRGGRPDGLHGRDPDRPGSRAQRASEAARAGPDHRRRLPRPSAGRGGIGPPSAAMGRSTYLDYNATQPLRPEARDAMLAALDEPSNASSVHSHGQAARRIVEEARQAVAALIGSSPGEIIFTGGATEANTTALNGLAV